VTLLVDELGDLYIGDVAVLVQLDSPGWLMFATHAVDTSGSNHVVETHVSLIDTQHANYRIAIRQGRPMFHTSERLSLYDIAVDEPLELEPARDQFISNCLN
jgi:hypothetical protein